MLEGIDVAEGTVRIYPKSDVAAHIIGYLSKMSDKDQIKENQAKGYDPGDLVGVSGVEQTMEQYLTANTNGPTGRKGETEVQVTSNGKIIPELTRTLKPAQSGDNVMLTIDLNLQLKLEEVLKDDIAHIQQVQMDEYNKNKADYDEKVAKRGGTPIEFAKSGAAVVLDAKTGQVLAMASYPSYDLNLFTGGISEADYKPLTDESTTPLFNKAVSSKGTPGSILKLSTALAGLMEGKLGLTEEISDEGPYTFGGTVDPKDAPSCWTTHYGNHANQTVIEGLKNSCNYFFFTVADRLGIDLMNKWADKLGLTSKTGIELPREATGQIGNQQIFYDNTKELKEQTNSIPKLVLIQIKGLLKGYGEQRNVKYNDDELTVAANALLKLVDGSDSQQGPAIRQIMDKTLGISSVVSQNFGWDKQIASSLSQLKWTKFMTVTSGIGQGVAAVTPIEVARYVAAIVNGGTVYNVHIVDKILDPTGSIVKTVQPDVFSKLNANKEYLEAIKKGMGEVVSQTDNGTAATYFVNYPYISEIGGKTGTAQVSKIDLENNSWFVCFAPYDDPEIVVVSYIPHGYSGGQSSLIAKDIITYYLDSKKRKPLDDIPVANSIVGDLYKNKEQPATSDDQNGDGTTDKNKNDDAGGTQTPAQ